MVTSKFYDRCSCLKCTNSKYFENSITETGFNLKKYYISLELASGRAFFNTNTYKLMSSLANIKGHVFAKQAQLRPPYFYFLFLFLIIRWFCMQEKRKLNLNSNYTHTSLNWFHTTGCYSKCYEDHINVCLFVCLIVFYIFFHLFGNIRMPLLGYVKPVPSSPPSN